MASSTLPETFKAIFTAAHPGAKPTLEDVPLQKPGKNQVVVKIEYFMLNPYSIYIMHGYIPNDPPSSKFVSGEGSGTVVAVGEDLKIPFKVGDRVQVQNAGSLAQYKVTESEDVYLIKDDLPFEEAACHYVNPMTIQSMGIVTNKGNHKAVIHTAGTSDLGKLLVRYFKLKGIKTINVVRRDDFTEELKKDGADYVLNQTDPDFDAKLKEVAQKEQATLAFDAIGGDFTERVVSAQPPGSVCHVYGMLSGKNAVSSISIGNLFQGKTVTGLSVGAYFNELKRTGETRKAVEEVHSLLSTTFRSHINKVFKLEEFLDAIAYYNQNASKGKVLVKAN